MFFIITFLSYTILDSNSSSITLVQTCLYDNIASCNNSTIVNDKLLVVILRIKNIFQDS